MKKIQSLMSSILALVQITCICSCTKAYQMTNSDLTDSIQHYSLKEGAEFYQKNRIQYPILDSIYPSIVTFYLYDLDYFQLKEIYPFYDQTPMYDTICPLLSLERDYVLELVCEELDEYSEFYKYLFHSEVRPTICLELDDLLEKDFQKTINKYSGGIMNVRKLTFFAGRDEKKIREIWMKRFDKDDYEEIISTYISTFLDSVTLAYDDYASDMIQMPVNIQKESYSIGNFVVNIPDSVYLLVKQYTKKEKDETLILGLRDFVVPLVLTGGAAIIYDLGTLGYDVITAIDDAKQGKLSAEDKLVYESTEVLYNRYVQNYMNSVDQTIERRIDNLKEKAFQTIQTNL